MLQIILEQIIRKKDELIKGHLWKKNNTCDLEQLLNTAMAMKQQVGV
jgi:hypothetical protein